MQLYIYTFSNGRGPEMRGRQIERLLFKKKRKKKKKKEFLGQIINTKKLYYFTN